MAPEAARYDKQPRHAGPKPGSAATKEGRERKGGKDDIEPEFSECGDPSNGEDVADRRAFFRCFKERGRERRVDEFRQYSYTNRA